jgi:hypothetical protein
MESLSTTKNSAKIPERLYKQGTLFKRCVTNHSDIGTVFVSFLTFLAACLFGVRRITDLYVVTLVVDYFIALLNERCESVLRCQ